MMVKPAEEAQAAIRSTGESPPTESAVTPAAAAEEEKLPPTEAAATPSTMAEGGELLPSEASGKPSARAKAEESSQSEPTGGEAETKAADEDRKEREGDLKYEIATLNPGKGTRCTHSTRLCTGDECRELAVAECDIKKKGYYCYFLKRKNR